MKCSNCNHENPEGKEKCEECGNTLIWTTAKLETETGQPTKSDPLDFSPGEKFGSRYQIVEEIGKGGMGKVFKARDLELDIVVALKMIKPELSSDPEMISRFKRELLLAREILHENIIRIHDLGEIDDVRYISMNYIEGNSLKEIIQSTGKLTIEKSIDIANQVCGALKAAHDKGIVHRDLKPQNIMIDKKGSAFVLDFGIARSVSSSTGETEAGIVLGTPDFMSPEQIRGKKADASSDIYSLGIILYEMVTGELPFKADNPTALLYLHLNETPAPPSKLNPQIPKKLEKIILKCLEKKKGNRYSSIAKVMDDLELRQTGQIKPIQDPEWEKEEVVKVVKEKPTAGGGRFFKNILRIFLLILIIYGTVSVLSLVNDSSADVKLGNLKVEEEVFFKNHFPMQKDWLPAAWETVDCNAWDTYVKLFPPESPGSAEGTDAEQAAQKKYTAGILASPHLSDFEKIAADFGYGSAEELQSIIDSYGGNFKFDQLFTGITCKKLDSYSLIKTNRRLNLPIMEKYADMLTIKVRVDFLAGNYEEGLSKLYRFMVFCSDILFSSTCLEENRTAMACFRKCCRELVPFLLNPEINPNAMASVLPLQEEPPTAAGEETGPDKEQDAAAGKEADAAPGEQEKAAAAKEAVTADEKAGPPPAKKEETPAPKKQAEAAPNKEAREKEAAAGEEVEPQTAEQSGFDSPTLPLIKDLIVKTLEKLVPQPVLYKEKLSLVRNSDKIFDTFAVEKPAYYAYGKFSFWEHFFSIKRYFFKKGVGFYQGLFEGLKYIENTRAKSIFINDYFKKSSVDNRIIPAGIPKFCFEVNTTRMSAKLVLILLKIKEHGLDSKEFSDLKLTEVFTNEFSGKPFELAPGEKGVSIVLTGEFKLDLFMTEYGEEHKQVLKSFSNFDIRSDQQVQSLFHSFEME